MLRSVYKKRLSFLFSELKNKIPENAISDMSKPEGSVPGGASSHFLGGYFVWIVLSNAVNVEKLKEEMKKEQVAVKFGTLFEVCSRKIVHKLLAA